MEEKEDFSGKYTERGYITKLLLSNFFGSLQKVIAPLRINKALEIGCGPGFSTQRLNALFPNGILEASEYRDDLVQEAKERNPGINIIQESIYDLQREDNSFDLVMAFEVFEHLEQPEVALRELHRVTKRYCLMSVPNEPIWRILNMFRFAYLKDFGNTPGHIQHWTPFGLSGFIKRYFEVRSIRVPLPWTVILAEKK